MRNGHYILALAALAASMAVSGCGGGGSDSIETTAPSKAEFIRQADAQCSKGNATQSTEIKAYVGEEHPKTKLTGEEQILLAVVLPNIEATMQRLGELQPPKGDEEKIRAIIAANQRSVEEAESRPSAALADSESMFAEGTSLSKAYGFKVCGLY